VLAYGEPVATYRSICRFCHAGCPILVDVEDGRATRVRGDKDDPLYRGFTCEKGRQLPAQHAHPDRLLHSRRRREDGSYEPVASGEALQEIAARVQAIVAEHGPRSVAFYKGTCASRNPATGALLTAWMDAIGSPMRFDSNTIDQPGKSVALALHGRWGAPPQGFDGAGVALLVGTNPFVTLAGGLPSTDPMRSVRDARRAGMKLLVIDPRRTETAAAADQHLQPRPGEDIAILACLLNVIISEQRHDAAFVEQHVRGFDELRRAVQPYAPEVVAPRAGVRADELTAMARAFATGGRGVATSGTGPSMTGRHSTVVEYLVLALNTICGRYLRAGEALWNPGVLISPLANKAQATPPWPAYGYGEKLRVRELADAACGLSTAALADEILLDGPDKVRALFCVGGNPVAAWPDHTKTWRAMQALDLLVTIDIKMSATAKVADYVIAPRLTLEIPGSTIVSEALYYYAIGFGYPQPYANYTTAVVDPPDGSDLIEDWQVFHELGRHMGLPLRVKPMFPAPDGRDDSMTLDGSRTPTLDELLDHLYRNARVPLAEVRARAATEGGAIYESDPVFVQPADDGWTGRLDVGNSEMMAELADAQQSAWPDDDRFPLRLVCRRIVGALNSSGRDLPKMARFPYNPAYLHPDDLRDLGLAPGDDVEITSDAGSLVAIVDADPQLRRGLVSMTHAFGDVPGGESDVRKVGSNTSLLTRVDRDFDRFTGMPRMSNVAVALRPLRTGG
jgi:anaerobic selenocysteine-containing dehydrogenase